MIGVNEWVGLEGVCNWRRCAVKEVGMGGGEVDVKGGEMRVYWGAFDFFQRKGS